MAEARWGRQWRQHGIFQPTKKDKTFDREELQKHLQALHLHGDMAKPLDAAQAGALLGVEQGGVWLPRGASLSLAKVANDLLQKHERLTCIWNTHIGRLESSNGRWLLFDDADQLIMSAQKVIVSAAMGAKALMASVDIRLPLKPVRGQLTIFSVAKNDPWAAQLPRVGISGDGYCLPAEELADGSHRWIVGSSFDEGEDDLEARESSDMFNREQAQGLLDYRQGDTTSLKVADCFVGIRCVAGDRLPIIGALTQRPGIFLATALGSRGVLWSALAAKLIVSQVLGDDFALLARLGFATDLVAALAPARFFAGALATPSAFGALASNSKPIFPSDPRAK
jgi:tRNA 5-methylaminomethyl-2-thiouridine biosynthesis bifunctional protein